MLVDFSPDQEAAISRIASHAGIGAEDLVRQAALRMIDADKLFTAAVREGKREAERGELMEDDEVRAWLELRERS